MELDSKHIEYLSNKFLTEIQKRVPNIQINGDIHSRYSGNLNISFAFVEGESLIMAVKGLAVSSG